MKNDSLNILKLFTRKLANCRYKVAPDALVKYMEEGRFGYTCSKDSEDVVTNEFVFADDVATLVSHIRSIFKEPHIFLKKEDVIQNTTVASKFDSVSLRQTYKDDKIWRVKNGTVAPEYIHAYVYEDNLAIYENRFIVYLIDLLLEMVTKKINELMVGLETLNKQMGSVDNQCFTPFDYVDFADEQGGIPVLLNADATIVQIINSLIKSKKLLIAFQSRELYVACKKAGVFNVAGLKATNIFLNDKDYFYCYNFYLNYLNKEPIFTTESKMYYGFVTVNLLSALVKSGFELDEEAENISINNSAHLKFSGLKFKKDPFTIDVSQNGDDEIVFDVTNLVDNNKAKYVFKIINQSLAKTMADFTSVSDYAKKLIENQPDDVIKTYFVNDIEDVVDYNALYILPNKANVATRFMKAVKSCVLLVEGSDFLHTRYCPVCGSKLIAPNEEDYSCVNCSSLYHIFRYTSRDLIWIKNLPAVNAEKHAKTEESLDSSVQEEVKASAINEAPAPVEKPVTKTIIQTVVKEEKGPTKVCSNCHYEMAVANHYCPNCGKEIDIVGNVIEREEVKETIIETVIKEVPAPVQEVVEEVTAVEEPVVETQPEPVATVVEEPVPVVEEVPVAPQKEMGLKKSFVAKLSQSGKENQLFYSELKNYLLSFKRVYTRVSWNYDTFNLGRDVKVKIAVRGKTLVVFFALDPKEYENTKYYPHDMGDLKKFEETPMMIKVKSDRSVKYAKELIDVVLEGVDKKKVFEEESYEVPYYTDEELVKEGLAKIVERNI